MMIRQRLQSGYWRPLALLFSIAMGVLASGCLWGVVQDASTGAPIGGATVTYTDSNGQTGTATTDANGIYYFDQTKGPLPAAGNVNFSVNAGGYGPLAETRLVQFNDSPSAIWEIQNFGLTVATVQYHNAAGGFSILLPSGWEIRDNFWGTGTVMAVPLTGSPDYPGDISVGVNPSPPGPTLESWLDDTLSNVCNMMDDCHEVERGETTIDGMRALWTVVSYRITSDSEPYTEGRQLEELAYFFKKGTKGYIIDLTATADNFPRLRSLYERIGQSFQFD